jgi:hypothetical protein
MTHACYPNIKNKTKIKKKKKKKKMYLLSLAFVSQYACQLVRCLKDHQTESWYSSRSYLGNLKLFQVQITYFHKVKGKELFFFT